MACPALLLVAAGASSAASASSAAVPFATTRPAARELWREGLRFENEGFYARAATTWEKVVALEPGAAHLYWRIARTHFRRGQALPMADEEGRRRAYEQTQAWAARGSLVDPRCAECVLYEFLGLSSGIRLRGMIDTARGAGQMRELLDHALDLRPSHVDNEWNHELANLYFAAGVFYKILPESRLAQWAIGAKRDRERSIAYQRQALEVCDKRVDYHVSLGATLVCEGMDKERTELVQEGLALLGRVPELRDFLDTDPIDRDHAAILAADPERSCEYSRDAWRRAEGR